MFLYISAVAAAAAAFEFICEIPEYAIISLNRDMGVEHAILYTHSHLCVWFESIIQLFEKFN